MTAPTAERRTAGRFAVTALAFLGTLAIFCSLPGSILGSEVETRELKLAVETLRRENASLKRSQAVAAQELAVATNRASRLLTRQSESRSALCADDDEARGADEWRSFLSGALKALRNADAEVRELRKRLRQMLLVSEQALRTAEKVEPSRRAALEIELRQNRKILDERESEQGAIFPTEPNLAALESARVIGVQLELGVVALSVGRDQGARVGMPFVVMRDKAVVAVLVVVETRESRSLAMIEQMDPARPARKGDAVALRKS